MLNQRRIINKRQVAGIVKIPNQQNQTLVSTSNNTKKVKNTRRQIEKKKLLPKTKDFINSINDGTLVKIFKYLPLYDRLEIEKVCLRWKRLGPSAWLGITNFDPSSFNIDCSRFFIPWFDKKNKAEKLVTAIRKMKNLKTLKIQKDCYSDRRKKEKEFYSQILQNASQEIAEIEIRTDGFSSNTMSIPLELGHFNALQRLVIIDFHLNNTALKEITAKSTLVHLNLEKCCFKEGAKFTMSNLINLEYLNLFKYAWACGGHYIRINDLKNCKKLKYLNLASRYCIPKSDLRDIAQLIHLEFLDLDGLEKLDNKAIIGISNNCKKIKELKINGCRLLSKKGLNEIKKLENLEHLEMKNVKKAKDDVFTGMKNLDSLSCNKCKGVTDTGIINVLNNCPKLRHLNVIDTKVTSKTVVCAINVVHQRKNNDPSLDLFVADKTVSYPQEMNNAPSKLTVHFHIPRKRRIFNLDTGCYSSEESQVSDDEDDDDDDEDEEESNDDDDDAQENKNSPYESECDSDSCNDLASEFGDCSDDYDEDDDDDDLDEEISDFSD